LQAKLELKRGVYVRVFGTLRSFQGTKQLLAYSVRPVTDHDEVTFHFLEVCYVKAQLMKQHSGAGGGAGAGGGGGSAWNAAPPAHPYAAAGGGGGGAPAHVSGNVRDDVRAVYESPMGRGSEGISIDAVVNALGGKYTQQAVQEAVEHLVNMEGVLYSTIDERHFKSVNT
jgi:replication factor A2